VEDNQYQCHAGGGSQLSVSVIALQKIEAVLMNCVHYSKEIAASTAGRLMIRFIPVRHICLVRNQRRLYRAKRSLHPTSRLRKAWPHSASLAWSPTLLHVARLVQHPLRTLGSVSVFPNADFAIPADACGRPPAIIKTHSQREGNPKRSEL
jgi:hypothetical protein